MRTTLGRKSFVIGLGLAMLLSAFVVGGGTIQNILPGETSAIFLDDFDSETTDSISPSSPSVDISAEAEAILLFSRLQLSSIFLLPNLFINSDCPKLIVDGL